MSVVTRLRRWIGLALLGIGVSVSAYALHHPAKAALGQWLLTTAWEKGEGRPWPWADFTAIAKIEAPRIGASAIALSSASGAAMAWGPGLVTSAEDGVVAFAGHRDSHFAFLGELAPGDEVMVTKAGVTERFRVTTGAVIDSRIWRLPKGRNRQLVLSTCWPLGANTEGPLRLILYADPVEEA